MSRQALIISSNIISTVFVGAVVTYYINHHLNLGPLLASAVVGLLAWVIGKFFSNSEVKDVAPCMYCGSFVGMSSAQVLGWLPLVLAGLLAGVLCFSLRQVGIGTGGKLGSIAFMSTITVGLALLVLKSL